MRVSELVEKAIPIPRKKAVRIAVLDEGRVVYVAVRGRERHREREEEVMDEESTCYRTLYLVFACTWILTELDSVVAP